MPTKPFLEFVMKKKKYNTIYENSLLISRNRLSYLNDRKLNIENQSSLFKDNQTSFELSFKRLERVVADVFFLFTHF